MEKVNNISFNAKPINRIQVLKLCNKTKRFTPINATFVKIDPNNKFDINAVETSAKLWENARYMKKIATASHWIKTVPIELYAITTQEKNFKKLKHNNILGFAEIRPDDNDKRFSAIYHLQVKYNAAALCNNKANYKKVGSSILTSLKCIYNNISLFSEDNPMLINYYKKKDFIVDNSCPTRLLWSSNPFMKLLIYYENIRKQFGI